MGKIINVDIKNKLFMEEKYIYVYRHHTRTGHMISHDSSITVPLPSGREKDDYLQLSVNGGDTPLKYRETIELPLRTDFEFSSRGSVTLVHSGSRLFLKIPPGAPGWQLKLTSSAPTPRSSARIVVRDD